MRNCKPVHYSYRQFDDCFSMSLAIQNMGTGAQCGIRLDIPRLDENAMFDTAGSGVRRQICYVLRNGPIHNKYCHDINYMYVVRPHELLLEWVGKALSSHLEQFYITGTIIEPQKAQARLNKILATHPLSHVVSGVARHYPPKIYLDLGQTTVDQRMPFNTKGVLDWTSISSSDSNCGKSMYLAAGVEIKDGQLVKRGKTYCDLLDQNLVIPEYSRRRATAANFKAVSELVEAEEPQLYSCSHRFNLHGKHLLTVHAIIPGVYKEQIVVSKSAAHKLRCVIREKQVIVVPGWCTKTLEVRVKENDVVTYDDIVASYDDNGMILHTAHVDRASTIESITQTKTHVSGQECIKLNIQYKRIHRLSAGDKITNRHGNKGIVRIVPDNQMPLVDGQPAEVVTNALATLTRRNPGQIVEAMLNKIGDDVGSAPVPHFMSGKDGQLPVHLLKDCKPVPHEYNGQTVMAWSGKLFWVVLDKFSHQTRSHVTERKPVADGAYADIGGRSGTKLHLSAMQIMLSKGMRPLLERYMDDNATGIERIQKYIYCMSH